MNNYLKKITSLLLIATVIPQPALATEWVQTASTDEGTVISVDKDTIVRNGSRVFAWEKWDYRLAPKNPKRTYIIEKDRREYDCSAGVSRLREALEYDANGNVLKSYSWVAGESSYRAAPPESVGAATFSAVCDGAGSPPPG
ncbi:surface-adhesin E family protein [Sphingomonas sp. PP-F2F-G114-C0414]|uniref:surface-adhesin E family protein n=1 Tax=Sphingomonas sp. PP-F2F-G114-C0414 TaxID=2135662 RepID=UPI0011C3BFF1|nr:surface-adhesin E family protein [Sphingomonas sp. PP-F2F-G114-C0414]